MKKIVTLLVSCVWAIATYAHEIAPEEALQQAVASMDRKAKARKVRGTTDFVLAHTQRSAGNGKALYYVFRNERGGFLITGADHRARPVLGYAEGGSYEQALAIPGFRAWADACQQAMLWLACHEEADAEPAALLPDVPARTVTDAERTILILV